VPTDISIQSVSPVSFIPPQRPSANQASATVQIAPTQSTGINLATIPPPINPDFYLDPALNIVVLQFFDSKGNVTQSIPSQKQLDAYRLDGGTSTVSTKLHPVSQLL
jgi:hypothetical protein